jgi:hypothetical protein
MYNFVLAPFSFFFLKPTIPVMFARSQKAISVTFIQNSAQSVEKVPRKNVLNETF